MRWAPPKSPESKSVFQREMPPALRWQWAPVAVLWACVQFPLLAMAMDLWGTRSILSYLRPHPWSGRVLILCLLAPVGYVLYRRWRVARAYRAAGGALCAACLQPLAGLTYTGPCPECGRPYHPHADLELWQNAGIVARPPREPKP